VATVAAAGVEGGIARVLGLRQDPVVDPAGDPGASSGADTPPRATPEPQQPEQDPASALPTVCPPEMVAIGPLGSGKLRYCIDVAEHPGIRHPPTTRITHEAAEAACASAGKRLCTASQWRHGCTGTAGRRYPYGDQHEPDRCNEAHPSGRGNNLTRTGARDGCVTASGLFDMVGNVSEWVQEGAALGGDATTVAPSCNTRQDPPRGRASGAIGFRCCADLAAADPDAPAAPALERGKATRPG
jgi:hypothetical protein